MIFGIGKKHFWTAVALILASFFLVYYFSNTGDFKTFMLDNLFL